MTIKKTVNIAEYLFTRLAQLGVGSLHGVPGDFNLLALDYVESSGLTWVGNANELNGGYAADAYGRRKGLSAILTTFGVGELSCVNAIAGAYAEYCPVVKIVGTPNRAAQTGQMLLHHTLGDGDFAVFANMFKHVTIAQANLVDHATAAAEIDRVLRECTIKSRPVYIALPTDMVAKEVDAKLLDTPIDVSTPKGDEEAETVVADLILRKLYKAKRPAILMDAGANRHKCIAEAEAFALKSGIPTYIAPMGKGVANETLPNFVGMYIGAGSRPEIRSAVESSDCLITIGNVKSDLNTAGFSYQISRLRSIDLHFDNVIMDTATYGAVYMKRLLQRLVDELEPGRICEEAKVIPVIKAAEPAKSKAEGCPPDAITHSWLWPRLSSWLQEDDVIITETGTSFVGIWETKLPRGAEVICQTLWSSIGYGVGAAQGAALAAKEEGKGRRTICFEGDGSFQMTCQEVSTIIHHDLDVTMFVIENDGYEIERWVHGYDAKYNDIPQWRYDQFPEAFTPKATASRKRVKTWKISTKDQLEELFADKEFANGKGLQFVEMHMPRNDAPQTLIDFAVGAAKRAS